MTEDEKILRTHPDLEARIDYAMKHPEVWVRRAKPQPKPT